ncbi:UNVERIFIED_CONTAM: hypothetical protein PYX00_007229 [Menopon gallinae]|uniref:Protein YIF1 n=1 Tax=Menopon gallinae TaxID=328185 RepID=A0AAW2HIP7_9NEOP
MNFNASAPRPPNKLGAKRFKTPRMDAIPTTSSYPATPFNPYNQYPPAGPPGVDPIYPNVDGNRFDPTMAPQAGFNPNFQYGGNRAPPDPGRPLGNEFLINPIVKGAAMTYGEQLMGTGKEYVDKSFKKYVPVTRLKYYFAVDTAYVYKKLGLIFFPFAHKDWSIKYASNEPVQPRYEVNAPDLYIPTMAYLTYVLVAGLALGTQNRFTPEVLGIQASSALAWSLLEVLVHVLSLYVTNISTSLTTIDILAYSGYKFVGIIFAVLTSMVFYRFGYYLALIYFSISLSFFLIRTLKVKILPVNTTPADPYSVQPQHVGGDKRRMYLLLFIVGVQPCLIWWMSYHLVPTYTPPVPS